MSFVNEFHINYKTIDIRGDAAISIILSINDNEICEFSKRYLSFINSFYIDTEIQVFLLNSV